MTHETIGFIGTGQMGLPMAHALLDTGYELRVYNRSGDKIEPLVRRGAHRAATPEAVAEPGGLVLSMLADEAAVHAVAGEGLAAALGSGGVHIGSSTLAPATTASLARMHAEHGAAYLAAPVFGRPDAAAARKLWVLLAGPAAAKERARPLLNALGQGIHDFGETAEAASTAKLAGNFLAYAAAEAMAEASAFAEKQGVPRNVLLEMVTSTLFTGPVYEGFAQRIAAGEFDSASFAARLGYKDMRAAWESASDADAPMPLLDLLCERFEAAIAKGRGEADATVLARESAETAGLSW